MNEDELTAEGRVNISKFLRCLDLFHEIDKNMRLGEARSFLTVALSENMTVGEVGRRTGIPVQTVSTYLRTLGEGLDRKGKPAMGLLTARKSPFDAREMLVRLTPKGLALTERIRAVVFG